MDQQDQTESTPDAPVPMRKYELTARQVEQVGNAFTYHPPKPDQLPRYERLRNEARCLAWEIVHHTPPSREQSLALTHLEDAVMWANAAIARNE